MGPIGSFPKGKVATWEGAKLLEQQLGSASGLNQSSLSSSTLCLFIIAWLLVPQSLLRFLNPLLNTFIHLLNLSLMMLHRDREGMNPKVQADGFSDASALPTQKILLSAFLFFGCVKAFRTTHIGLCLLLTPVINAGADCRQRLFLRATWFPWRST